ncbi:MAG TPA: squalene/phytoene synthase family protein [Solirubrobacteraceae bacterium]|nr:squalene/phytoene synthase family protein [Solirubrobacteraceae bacterium]
MALLADASPSAPAATAVMARAGGENFPVASRVLPARSRAHLLALYGFARLVDTLGDEAPGDRLAALDWLEEELDRAYAGRAAHPLLVRLQATLRECGLPREPFQRLLEANRVDQRVTRYETWDELLGYCTLSANPVGELVLHVVGHATPERIRLSDSICSALQLAEHWQDVAEDHARGRIYLPGEDRRRFGVRDEELAGGVARLGGPDERVRPEAGVVTGGRAATGGERRASWRLRALLTFEVARTRELLSEGESLIATLHGRERLAVAAFAGGARAALEAIERAGYDVLAGPPQASRARRAAATARLLAEQRR